VRGFEALNAYLERCCGAEDARRVSERPPESLGEAWTEEAARRRPLPGEPWARAEVMTGRGDAKARVSTNPSSVPVGLSGRRGEVRHGGQVVAGHERLQGPSGEALQLDP
jgi:hypothetical protein